MLPIDPQFAALADAGRVEECDCDAELAPILAQIASIEYDFE